MTAASNSEARKRATQQTAAANVSDEAGLREAHKIVAAWLDDDEPLRIPDTEWGRSLYAALRAVLAAHPAPEASP